MSEYFRGFGLRIASEFAIPGAQACGPGTPDLTVVEGSARLDVVARELVPYQVGGDSLLFTVPGLARYRCDGGRTITVEPERGSVEDDVAALLIATAIPACLWMRGEIVLHAAAAVSPGERMGIAFAGPSGSGKSTLLAALLERDATVVSDDTICVRENVAAGLPAAIQLRLTASGEQRRILPVPPERQLAECELGMLVVAGATQFEPVRIRGAAALEAILRSLHRPLVPRILGLTPGLLPRMATLASSLAVYSVYSLNESKALEMPAAVRCWE